MTTTLISIVQARPSLCPSLHSSQHRRRKHRGKRGGININIQSRPHWASLPSILLANVQALDNKLDDLRAHISFQRDINCNVLCFTEIWLHPGIPDSATEPTNLYIGWIHRLPCLDLCKDLNCSQTSNPDVAVIVAADFNQANLKKVMPEFHQHIDCATRGINTLDHCYTPFKNGYRMESLPVFRQSDHTGILLRS